MKNLIVSIIVFSFLFNHSAEAQDPNIKVVKRGANSKQRILKKLIGYGDGNELRSIVNAVYIFKDGKELNKQRLSDKQKEKRFIAGEDYIYYFYITGNPKKEGAFAYMEKRDFNFNLVGQPIKVMDLHATKGVAFGFDYNSLKVEYNKKSNRFILSFVAWKDDEDSSYIKASIIDTDGHTLNSFAYKVEGARRIRFSQTSSRVLENGDGMISFLLFDSGDYKQVVTGAVVVYIPGDGGDLVALPVEPELQQMAEIGISPSIDKNGNVYYGVVSNDFEADNSVLTLYKFNVESQENTKNSYKMKLKDHLLFRGYKGFYLNEVLEDENNSKYVDLTLLTEEQRHVVLKLDESDNLVWISALEKRGVYNTINMSTLGDLSFIDNEDDLVFIINVPINQFREGVFYPSQTAKQVEGEYITLKARFDKYSGEVTYEQLKFNGRETVDLVIDEAQKTDQNGVYKVQLRLGDDKRDFKTAIVDFN